MSRKFLLPDAYYESAYAIDYAMLFEKGVRALIYDIDNTLVEHGAPADDRSIALAKRLTQMGFRLLFLSNNDEARVKPFADAMAHSAYICKAHKPSVTGYQAAMKELQTDVETTVFIGDQIFTDIWGANRAGLRAILVDRIAWHEEPQIHLKRILEFFVRLVYFAKGGRKLHGAVE